MTCNNVYMSIVMTIADARRELPGLVRRFSEGATAPIVIGAHRRPTAVIGPIDYYSNDVRSLRVELHRLRHVIAHLADAAGISSVELFGSVARSEETSESDVDLLVALTEQADYFDLAQFAADVETLLRRRVDVVDRRSLEPGHPILAEAVPL